MEVAIIMNYGVEKGVDGHVISVVCWEPFPKKQSIVACLFCFGYSVS